MGDIWKQGFARGADRKSNPFDEAIEKKWSDIWLFHANTIRFAAAMAGGGDYGVFADGRYQLTQKIQELADKYPQIAAKMPDGIWTKQAEEQLLEVFSSGGIGPFGPDD